MSRFILVCFIALSATLNAGAQISLVPFSSGFSDPVDIKNCGDERLFIVDQPGYIYIVDTAGNKLATPFLDIQTRTKFGSEQGLLGLAFPADYHESGYFYVNYTAQTRGNTRISRFRVTPLDSNIADQNSEEILMEIWQPYSNHNGGHLAFGPDGYLYIGTGDGGSGGDPQNRAQNRDTLLGKMLRIAVDPAYQGYKIPPNNAYVCSPNSGAPEIWALGMRNPWRFSFDRCNGDLWIGDVGQNAIEEVDFQPANSPAGLNYGWRCYEGNSSYDLSGGCQPQSSYVAPVATYTHSFGCSITGGYRYRGALYNDMFGKYFYTDYCTPTMYTLESDGMGGFTSTSLGTLLGSSYSSFGEDMWGELYIASLTGSIYKFQTTDCTPVASINCDVDTVNDCGFGSVKLSVPAGRDFTYTWYHDGNLLPDDSSGVDATVAGTYVVEVANPSTACTNSDTIIVDMIAPVNLSIIGLDTLYCIYNQAVNLTPSIPGGYFSGSGVNCTVFDPATAGEGIHEVKYTYTTAQGCTYETTQDVRVDICLGLNDNSWLKTVALYPNPNRGTFTLEMSSDRSKIMTVEISTVLGQIIYSNEVELITGTTKFQPNYKIEKAGIYFVKLNDGSNSFTHKMRVD